MVSRSKAPRRRTDPAMPKRPALMLIALSFALGAIGLAACGNGSPSSPPTQTPYVSPSPNPAISSALVSVTFQGTPVPNIPVEISTPIGNNTASPRPGTPFATVTTQPVTAPSPGYAKFKHLKYKQTYCWVAVVSTSVSFSQCAGPITWQYATVPLGN